MLYIFDWDGTLCDSTEKIAYCMIQAAMELDLPPISQAEVVNIIGLGLPEAIRSLFPSISNKEAEALRVGYSKFFVANDHGLPLLFEGVEHTLQSLKKQGQPIAVATGKSRRGLDRILERLGWSEVFDATRCADETASKPHPLMLNELLEEFACGPTEAVMIGDTEYDMDMARQASVPRIAVTYGAHSVERLKPFAPVMCVDAIAAVLDYAH